MADATDRRGLQPLLADLPLGFKKIIIMMKTHFPLNRGNGVDHSERERVWNRQRGSERWSGREKGRGGERERETKTER